MTQPYISPYRIIISGNIVESFQYARPIGYKLLVDTRERPYQSRRPRSEQRITASSLSRTRNHVIRSINANCYHWQDFNQQVIAPQFLTYTFADNITSLDDANALYTNYIKRLNYHYYNSKQSVAKYVTVPEFQKRGAVHYHTVFFNLPQLDQRYEYHSGEFASYWEHGHIKIKKIAHIPNVGRYMTKYMTKDATDTRLVGRKKYFSSRKLHKPTIITFEHLASQINDYLCTLESIHGYISKPKPDSPYPLENPTFCATYHLNPEQLQTLKKFYSLPSYESDIILS
jgi:hypothetical protein